MWKINIQKSIRRSCFCCVQETRIHSVYKYTNHTHAHTHAQTLAWLSEQFICHLYIYNVHLFYHRWNKKILAQRVIGCGGIHLRSCIIHITSYATNYKWKKSHAILPTQHKLAAKGMYRMYTKNSRLNKGTYSCNTYAHAQ